MTTSGPRRESRQRCTVRKFRNVDVSGLAGRSAPESVIPLSFRSMDPYDRIVYRALGVSDLLSSEHQMTAAAVALLKAAEIPIDEEHPDAASTLAAWRDVALAFVEAGANMLRHHALDGAIGGYDTPDRAIARAISEGQSRVMAIREKTNAPVWGPIPDEDARNLATALTGRVVEWAKANPEGLAHVTG
jgi:hypothetical protein